MTKIYFIRHCEALGNTKRIFQGSTDCDISENGAKQLEFLRERFKDEKIDAVYSSPLIRALKTAHSVADQNGLVVLPMDELVELHGGVVEGKLFKKVFEDDPVLAEVWDNHPQDFAPKDGEPMRHAYDRIWEAVSAIVKSNPDKTVAVASHGGPLRCLFCRVKFGTIERLKDMEWCENTAVTTIEFDENLNGRIISFNDHSHLPDEYLPKRNRLSTYIGGNK